MAVIHSRAKQQEVPEIHVALLRGINLGGKNRLPMEDLLEMFSAAGCNHLQSYIQSGNVLFSALPNRVSQLPENISNQIEERFGFRVPVVLRTVRQIGEVLKSNPFLKSGAAEESLHVMFLAGLPEVRDVRSLDPDRSPPDTFIVQQREIYLQLPNGVARSKLTNGYFDARLKTVSTSRNWRTITKLYQMATDIVL